MEPIIRHLQDHPWRVILSAILVLGACTGDSSSTVSGCPPGGLQPATPFGSGPLGLGQVVQTGAGGSMAPGPVGLAGSQGFGGQGLGGSLVVALPQGGCTAITPSSTNTMPP